MAEERSKKEVIPFKKKIPPNTTDVLHERVKAAGTIEGVRIRFYAGQEGDLQVNPYVERKGGAMDQLFSYVATGDSYLSGEDDYFEYPVAVAVDNDEFVKVRVKNVDTQYTYTLSCDVIVDYYGGKNRVIAGVSN